MGFWGVGDAGSCGSSCINDIFAVLVFGILRIGLGDGLFGDPFGETPGITGVGV